MRKLLFLLLLFPATCFGADATKTIYNPFTGKFDYILRLSSTPISSLLGGTTLASTVEGLSAGSGSTLSADVVRSSHIAQGAGSLHSSTTTLSAQTAALSIATHTLLQGGSTAYAPALATAQSTAAITTRLNNLDSSTGTSLTVLGSTQTKLGGLSITGSLGVGINQPVTKLHVIGDSTFATYPPTGTASAAISFTPSGASGPGSNHIVGYTFTVSTGDIRVTHLGAMYMIFTTFLSGTRNIKIFDSNQNEVVSATASATTDPENNFRYVELSSMVILRAGMTYTILSQLPVGDSYGTSIFNSVSSSITYGAARSKSFQTDVIYTAATDAAGAYTMGPNFKFVTANSRISFSSSSISFLGNPQTSGSFLVTGGSLTVRDPAAKIGINGMEVGTAISTTGASVSNLHSSTATLLSTIKTTATAVTSALASIASSTATLTTAISTTGADLSGWMLFKGTGPAAIQELQLFKSTSQPEIDALKLYRSTSQVRLDNLDTSTGTLTTVIKASATLVTTQFTAAFSSISTLQTATGTLSAQTTALALNAGNTNYLTVLGSTQTKLGGLNVVGNVGLGTTNPSYILDVVGSSASFRGGIMMGTAFTPNMQFASQGNFISFGQAGVSEDFIGYKSNQFYLADSVGGGDVIDPSLSVGGSLVVGTYTATSKLDVLGGSVSVRGSLAAIGINAMDVGTAISTQSASILNLHSSTATLTTRLNNLDTSTATLYSLISATSTNAVRVDSSTQTKLGGLNVTGYLGVGTSSPQTALYLINNTTPQIRITPVGGVSSTESVKSMIDMYGTFDNYWPDQIPRRAVTLGAGYSGGTWGNEVFTISVGSGGVNDAQGPLTERMRINGAGNVGIGTIAPNLRLQINGSTDGLDGIAIGQIANNQSVIQTFIDGHWSDRSTYAGACCNKLQLQPDAGEVGIGMGTTDPAYKLDVYGTFRSTSTTILAANNGNVGVGTTNPNQKLQVSGDIGIPYGNTIHAYGVTYSSIVTTGWDGSNDYLGFMTPGSSDLNASMKMKITRDGNVGIGTTSPGAILDIQGANSPSLRIANGAASGYGFIQFGKSGTDTNNWHMGSEGDATFSLWNKNWGAGAQIMKIKSDGNVGFGTTNPTSRLDVAGGTATIRNGFIVGGGTLTVNGGNVGVGIANPGAKLHIGNASSGANFATGANMDIVLGQNHLTGGYTALEIGRSADTSGYVGMQGVSASGSSYGNIVLNPAGGNVGIGSAVPRQKMDVTGNGIFSGIVGIGTLAPYADTKLHVYSPASNPIIGIQNNGNSIVGMQSVGSDLRLGILSGSDLTDYIRILSGGNVGIGTSNPLAKLEIARESAYTSLESGGNGLEIRGTDQSLYMGADTTNRVGYIQSVDFGTAASVLALNARGGNVGIGSVGPGAKLDIYESNASADTQLKITQGSPSAYGGLSIQNSAATNALYLQQDAAGASWLKNLSGQVSYFSGTSSGHEFYTNSDEVNTKMVLTSAGNVGINTASPGRKLEVNGSVGIVQASTLTFGSGGGNYDYYGTISQESNNFVFNSFGDANYGSPDNRGGDFLFKGHLRTLGKSVMSNILFLKRDGTVGVGTTNPTSRLDVVAPMSVSTTVAVSGSGFKVTPYDSVRQQMFSGSSLNSKSASLNNNIGGYRFTVGATPLQVTHLGIYRVDGGADISTWSFKTVAIFDQTGTSVAYKVVFATETNTEDSFVYSTMTTPVQLNANTDYTILQTNPPDSAGGWYGADVSVTTTAYISNLRKRYRDNQTAMIYYDSDDNTAIKQYHAGGFKFTVLASTPSFVAESGGVTVNGATTMQPTSTPPNPASSNEGRTYWKGGKFIVQYNDAGTVRYKYLDMTGTGVTWTHSTTAP